MSTEDQMAVIGQMVTDRTEAKRQIALLEHQLTETGEAMQSIVFGIRTSHQADSREKTMAALRWLRDHRGVDGITERLNEVSELRDKVKRLTEKLNGLHPKNETRS